MNMSLYRETEETSSSTSTSTSTSRDTKSEALELIAEAYLDSIGRRMPSVAVEECMGMIDAGMLPATIMLALDETAGAPRPSWAYCRAILAGCLRDGALTPEGYKARNDRWRGRRKAAATPATDYSQRQYSDGEMQSLFSWPK